MCTVITLIRPGHAWPIVLAANRDESLHRDWDLPAEHWPDRPGVIADVAATLRDEKISMAAMIQRGRSPDDIVPVVLMTHETEESSMARALARIAALDSSAEPPRMIRIETL